MSIYLVIANEGLLHLSEKILDQLSDEDICSLRLVCKNFNDFIVSQKCWYRRLLTSILEREIPYHPKSDPDRAEMHHPMIRKVLIRLATNIRIKLGIRIFVKNLPNIRFFFVYKKWPILVEFLQIF